MSEHIVSAFTDELDKLASDIMRMGSLVETMIVGACRSVSVADLELAEQLVSRDDEVDAIEADIERQIVSLIARRQPMAHDLRLILSALKISGELERIGDLSKNIAKRTLKLDDNVTTDMRSAIARMAQPVSNQLNRALDSYASANAELAYSVWSCDDDVDQHYNAVFREMLTYLIEDPRRIGGGAHMLFMAKNLERIGDHCTNIAEFVYFQVSGEYLASAERPKVSQV